MLNLNLKWIQLRVQAEIKASSSQVRLYNMSDCCNISVDLLPFPLIPKTPVNVQTAIDLTRFELDFVRAKCKEAQTEITEQLDKIEKSVINLEPVLMKKIEELTAELDQIKETQIKSSSKKTKKTKTTKLQESNL